MERIPAAQRHVERCEDWRMSARLGTVTAQGGSRVCESCRINRTREGSWVL